MHKLRMNITLNYIDAATFEEKWEAKFISWLDIIRGDILVPDIFKCIAWEIDSLAA